MHTPNLLVDHRRNLIIRKDCCWSVLQAGIIAMAAHWDDEELKGLQADFPDMLGVYDSNASKYNPRPGVRSCISVLSVDHSICVCNRSMLINDSCCSCTVYYCRCCSAGTGRTGYLHVAPNNYPFYSEDEKYTPIMQSDGGQLSGE